MNHRDGAETGLKRFSISTIQLNRLLKNKQTTLTLTTTTFKLGCQSCLILNFPPGNQTNEWSKRWVMLNSRSASPQQWAVVENVPVPIVRIAVCQEWGDRFCCLLVGEDIPQAVASQHQNIIRSVLVLRQGVDPDLNKDNKQKLKDVCHWCICIIHTCFMN